LIRSIGDIEMIRSILAALFFVFMVNGASAQCAIPNNLTNGTNASASQVMANFNAILTCVNNINPQAAIQGLVNKLRNSSLTSWFHGSSTLTITTSGGWGAEGVYIVPTGGSVTTQQIANGLSTPWTFWAEAIIGSASVSDLTVRFPIESLDAAPLAGQQVTCQIPALNNTGVSITPTLTVKRASAQDSNYTNTDVGPVALQTIANGATGTLAYSWTANVNSSKGLSIDIDFGNNFSATSKSIQIGGGFDCHVTPGVATGIVASPPSPIIPPAANDTAWNLRFYEASYDNGVAPGTVTHTGMVQMGSTYSSGSGQTSGIGFAFRAPKRITNATVTLWDGAGNINGMSNYLGGSWTDNEGPVSIVIIGQNSAILYNTRGSGSLGTTPFIHYTADATLPGG
jgi:hypothetical protein